MPTGCSTQLQKNTHFTQQHTTMHPFYCVIKFKICRKNPGSIKTIGNKILIFEWWLGQRRYQEENQNIPGTKYK